MITLILVGVAGGLALLAIRGLVDQAQVMRDWEMVLSPLSIEVYQQLERRVEGESKMMDYAYKRALRARAAGSMEEAHRLLDVGLRVVERTSPDMITLLRGMAVVSRMASAVAPVKPLEPQAFRLRELSGLALLAGISHRFVVSTAERFRLRAFVLRRGFGLIRRFLLSSTERIRDQRKGAEMEWERVAAAREDLKRLSTESLQTFHALLLSLAAEQR